MNENTLVPTIHTKDMIDILTEIRDRAGIPPRTKPKDYPVIIQTLIEATGTDYDTWNPDRTWWNIRRIISEDTSGYALKYIMVIANIGLSVQLSMDSTCAGFLTSDGQFYAGSELNHVWVEPTNGFIKQTIEQGFPTYTTRWVMVYFKNEIPLDQQLNIKLHPDTLYAIFDKIKYNYSGFSYINLLQSWEHINGANQHSSVTWMQGAYTDDWGLTVLPRDLNTSNVKNFQNTFLGCSTVLSLMPMNYSSATTLNNAHGNTDSLISLPLLDLKNKPVTTNIFAGARSLVHCTFANVAQSLVMTSSKKWSRATLVNLVNNMVDMTGQTAPTISLGAENLAKYKAEELALAAAKNFVMV